MDLSFDQEQEALQAKLQAEQEEEERKRGRGLSLVAEQVLEDAEKKAHQDGAQFLNLEQEAGIQLRPNNI